MLAVYNLYFRRSKVRPGDVGIMQQYVEPWFLL